jgi:hypothetical protein
MGIITKKEMEVIRIKHSKNILTDQEKELVGLLMSDCQTTGDIQSKLKRFLRAQ